MSAASGHILSLSPPGLFYSWANGRKLKSWCLTSGWAFWGTMCYLLCHWARQSCGSTSPLVYLADLVPGITSPAAQASSNSALAAASIPLALRGKRLLERTHFPSTSSGSLRLGKPPFTAGCSKGRGFLFVFFLPFLWPGRKQQNHRWCNSIRSSQGLN